MEHIADLALEILKDGLAAELAEVDTRANEIHLGITGREMTLATPAIPAGNYYSYNMDIKPKFPACIVFLRRDSVADDQTDLDELKVDLEIEFYVTGPTQENLGRLVARYARAARRVLRDPAKWSPYAFDPQIGAAFYSIPVLKMAWQLWIIGQ